MIPTTVSRRRFLAALLAAPAAAFALTKVAAQPALPTSILQGPIDTHVSPIVPQRSWPVKGVAIKVPSNRFIMWTEHGGRPDGRHVYRGDWDGAFKLEAGCSNPAYILADLYERSRQGRPPEPDWALQDGAGFLDWQMIYDWGCHCDQIHYEPRSLVTTSTGGLTLVRGSTLEGAVSAPRFTVNAFMSTTEEMTALRETLRMHCLSWQSTDPRYRTSWPGVGYTEEGA